MSFHLKTYQRAALDSLTRFLAHAQTAGLPTAWSAELKSQQLPSAVAAVPYRTDPFGDVPCVCLRIPTGGGKTLMASHAITRIAKEWCAVDYPVALWLTPSDVIRSQTLSALQTPGHPYSEALRVAYGPALRVCDLDAVHTIAPQDIGRTAIVIVATIQSFRIDDTANRRVYAFSESFEPHFRNLTPQQTEGLEKVTEADLAAEHQTFLTRANLGQVKTSLANLLALARPIVIVDEAHNTKTDRSFEALKRLNPACILELTATPIPKKTNVLYSVGAQELASEDMIKLPIALAEHTEWQAAVRDAILRRKQLETEALREPDYLRPLVLFQAEDKSSSVTVEVLRKHLIEQEHVLEQEIAVATGSQRELDGINLFDPHCPVRYVITVEALKEGWDCSFAYVLCSLQNVRSGKDVEQLLGRVLRMPYARRRKSAALNRAYAHVVARSFSEAADALVDRMVENMGFEQLDAAAVILPDPGIGDLFSENTQPPPPRVPTFVHDLPAQAAAELASHPDVKVIAMPGALTAQVSVRGNVTEALLEAMLAALPKKQQTEVLRGVERHNALVQASLAPADRGIPFAPVPLLCVQLQGELELIERQTLIELMQYDLLRSDPRPELPGFNLVESSNQFEIYVQNARLQFKQTNASQLSLDNVPTDSTEADLIASLDAQVRQPDVLQSELQTWIGRLIGHLIQERGFTLTGLVRARFALAKAIEQRLSDNRAKARAQGFQSLLFERADLVLATSPHWQFRFAAGRYPARNSYSGRMQLPKHYFPQIANLKSQGEEFECAKIIAHHPRVKHWVRNLERLPDFAFWLPTATDYFYPDFIAELDDGRLLVVEYKGEVYATNDDSREKRLVGDRWAKTSGNVFLMAEALANGMNVTQQIDAAIKP